MQKLLLIYHTLIHLKPIQIRYQLWYRIRGYWRKIIRYKPLLLIVPQQTNSLAFQKWIEKSSSFSHFTFQFLNISKNYTELEINWNESEFGKLWAYNLNYMDCLLQPGMDKKTGLKLIEQFNINLHSNNTGLDPYPISLRGINWIKFLNVPSSIKYGEKAKQPENFTSISTANITVDELSEEPDNRKQSIDLDQINASLYAQYLILINNLEYHLLGNHLLENGFSLLFGAYYFNDLKFYAKASEIIFTELKEQILNDGGHFERSPMYHQIILDRLLDCINLVKNNEKFIDQKDLLFFMQSKALKMLSWLNAITFSNGQIPLFNDSAIGIAPITNQLNQYASLLNLIPKNLNLSDSGFRIFKNHNYELVINIGQIGPSYQPGHAHADTFNFVINIHDKPLIVDIGISTYNKGKTRMKERGTSSHNTVTIDDKNSSEVWSSFRVGQRAKVKIINEEKNTIIAQHDGYQKMGTTHVREWIFLDNNIKISDTLTGNIKKGKMHLWLAPGLSPKKTGQIIDVGSATLLFENADSVNLISTHIPIGYNQFSKNTKIESEFNGNTKLSITILS